MDAVPYEFINRVCTKLKRSDIKSLQVKSSLWADVCRVHIKKQKELTISVYMAPSGQKFAIYIADIRGWNYRLAEFLRFDRRFIRITAFSVHTSGQLQLVQSTHHQYSPQPETFPVNRLTELLNWISFTIVDRMSLRSTEQDLLDACLRMKLITHFLLIAVYPETTEFLRYQLKSNDLRKLNVYGRLPDEFRADIVAFVCRPEFQSLECDFICFGMYCMDFLKEAVAYWRAMDAPWESAKITVKSTRNNVLDRDLASWLPQRDVFCSKFQVLNGEYSLDAEIEGYDSVVFQFGHVFLSDVSAVVL